MREDFEHGVVRRSGASAQVEIDQGLRSYMLSVYNYMAMGLGLTGLIAYFVSTSPALLQAIYGTPLQWVVMLAPLGFVFFLSFRVHKMSLSAAQMTFWAYAGINGVALSYIFMAYTGESIAKVFFITAGTFGAMSLYGYTTKRDLSGFGSFLFMGLIGLVIASLVNLFLQSSMMSFIVSIVGVGIFIGLTAYDTQKIKNMYVENEHPENAGKKAIMGALSLYLDFINLFIYLLRFMGDRR